MIPHRLSVLGVFATALHPQFKGLLHSEKSVRALHALVSDVPSVFITIGLFTLRMGMRDVLGVLPPRSSNTPAENEQDERDDMEISKLLSLSRPTMRRLLRAFFCRSVLVFQRRLMHYEPECVSAVVRVLAHGPYLNMLRTLPKEEAVDVCRGCFTFFGFTLYQLIVRADMGVTELSFVDEQVEWELLLLRRNINSYDDDDSTRPHHHHHHHFHLQRLRARMPLMHPSARMQRAVMAPDESSSMNLMVMYALLTPRDREEEDEASLLLLDAPFGLVILTALQEVLPPYW